MQIRWKQLNPEIAFRISYYVKFWKFKIYNIYYTNFNLLNSLFSGFEYFTQKESLMPHQYYVFLHKHGIDVKQFQIIIYKIFIKIYIN